MALAAIAATSAGCTADGAEPEAPRVAETQEIKSPLAREQAPALTSQEIDQFTKDRADFALDLYRTVGAQPGNVFLSPYSISSALAMTYAGAKGETATEMRAALHFSQDSAVLHRAFNRVGQSLDGGGAERSFSLEIANNIWVQSGRTYEQPFLDELAVNYGTGLQSVDFIGEPEPARLAINMWAAKHTANRVQGLFPEKAITRLTRFVLANAIYFNGKWELPFYPSAARAFHLLEGGVRDVPMMGNEGHLAYLRGEGFEAVELPYRGGETSMLVVVPEAGQFTRVESSLTGATLTSILDEATTRRVAVRMPKLKLEQDFPLTEPLKALGMPAAFGPSADFRGMSTTEPLVINHVVHKTFLAIDEQGTEAAAATGVGGGMNVSDPPPPDVRLTVDRPYLVAIVHKSTRMILFLGRVVDPR